MSEDLPPQAPPTPSAPDDELPEVQRRLWDLEWRLRRESGAMADKLAGIFKELVQATGWGSEAIAEGLTPVVADIRRRLTILEASSCEGTASQDPAFRAPAERVEVLERLIEDAVAAQRSDLALVFSRLDGIEERLASVEVWSERLAALEARAEEAQLVGERVDQAQEAVSALSERIGALDETQAQEAAQQGAVQQALLARAEAAQKELHEAGDRLARLEEVTGRLETMVEESAGDLGIRLGGLESAFERAQRELDQKVPQLQFASTALSMASQQAAIKDLKGQLAALMADPSSIQAPPALPVLVADQLQPLREALCRIEEQISAMVPEFDRLACDIETSRKGTEGLMANWMELENRLHFLAEKRQVDHLEARLDELSARRPAGPARD